MDENYVVEIFSFDDDSPYLQLCFLLEEVIHPIS